MTRSDPVDLAALRRRDGEKWAAVDDGVLPAWIADMDFPVAPAVRDALLHRVDTDLGYATGYDESDGGPLGHTFADRTRRRFDWAADPAHVRTFTDINQAMQVVLHLGTTPGDPVVLHSPACPPFADVLVRLDRPPRLVPVVHRDDDWQLNLDRIADEVRRGARALLLVNPHNPTGRVFRRAELEWLAALAVEHDLLVISDEVHADLVYEGGRHIPFASLSPEAAAHSVTLTSGSKAFNLGGIRCAVAHIGVPRLREAVDAHRGILFGQVGVLAMTALKAAWSSGDDWLDSVLGVIARNRQQVHRDLPSPLVHRLPEATFLSWIDCRPAGLGDDPAAFFAREARVMLFRGSDFGPEGRGHVRLNFATEPEVLTEILRRLNDAVTGLP
ncbi:MalY/PatB family protein [Micromonospora sp. NPDC051543]|uniref:MalY/PatB family protein n=1 Tax=Micromonospora sp. NPDC051543 TaxID=3364287 RepID=UPI003797E582